MNLIQKLKLLKQAYVQVKKERRECKAMTNLTLKETEDILIKEINKKGPSSMIGFGITMALIENKYPAIAPILREKESEGEVKYNLWMVKVLDKTTHFMMDPEDPETIMSIR